MPFNRIIQTLESSKTCEDIKRFFEKHNFKRSFLQRLAVYYSIPNRAKLNKTLLIEKLIEAIKL